MKTQTCIIASNRIERTGLILAVSLAAMTVSGCASMKTAWQDAHKPMAQREISVMRSVDPQAVDNHLPLLAWEF